MNHYCRDSVGALEVQLEDSFLTVHEYHLLNSLFFIPNVFMPLVGGLLSMRLGAVHVLIICTFISAMGICLFTYGLYAGSIEWFFIGRTMTGFVYEVIDCVPINILGPIFKPTGQWGVVVGYLNAFLRCGSILNFILTPYLYITYGLKVAVAFTMLMGYCGLLLATWTMNLYTTLEQKGETGRQNDGDSDKKDLHKDDKGGEMSLCEMMPLHKYTSSYWIYILGAGFTYAAMVPFWYIGSKYLQNQYNFSLSSADAFLVLPEGCIVLVGPILGQYIDKTKPSSQQMFRMLTVANLIVPLAYILLIAGSSGSTPSQGMAWIGMVLLGFGYAGANSFIWTLVNDVCLPEYLEVQSGLLAGSLNLLPAIMLPILSHLGSNEENGAREQIQLVSQEGNIQMACLALCGGMAGLLSYMCAWVLHSETNKGDVPTPEDGRRESYIGFDQLGTDTIHDDDDLSVMSEDEVL